MKKTQLTLNEEQRKSANEMAKEARAYRDSIADLARRASKTERRMWSFVRDIFPEVDDQSGNLNYNEESGVFTFINYLEGDGEEK